MISKTLTLGLLATALGTAAALAQAPNAPSTPSAPAQTAPSSGQHGGSGQFLTHLGREQIRGSKLVGVNIYGPNDERVGDVNDVILDRNGNATAVVIGVGGFLGIGEKDVAVPYRMVEWRFGEPNAATTNTGTGAGAGTGVGTGSPAGNAGRTTDGGTAPGAPTTSSSVAGTANTGTANTGPGNHTASGSVASGNTMAASNTANQGYPSRGTIRLTRADLQNAPSFSYSTDDPATRPQGDRPAGSPSPNAPAGTPGTAPPSQRP